MCVSMGSLESLALRTVATKCKAAEKKVGKEPFPLEMSDHHSRGPTHCAHAQHVFMVEVDFSKGKDFRKIKGIHYK